MEQSKLISLTAELACSYVAKSRVTARDVPALIAIIYNALSALAPVPPRVEVQLPLTSKTAGARKIKKLPAKAPRRLRSSLRAMAIDPHAPAIPVADSVQPGFLACLVCGERLVSLKPHLRSAHGITAEDYRRIYSLDSRYPFVAPELARLRSRIAKASGFGPMTGR